MIIRTKTEIKTLLQITATTYDTVITALIPYVSDWLIDYTNNKFKDEYISYSASTISFASETGTINDSDSQFLENDLTNADYISIENSLDNDGLYRVESVEAGTITLHDDEVTLNDEDAGEGVTIYKVVIPRGLYKIFADMIKYDVDTHDRNVSSESLGDHSITYNDSGDYPQGILKRLGPYRKLSWQ